MKSTPAPSAVVPAIRSLRWRLPLLIAGLVTVILVTFLWAAHRRVEATLMRTAGERAQRAADQIAGALDGRRRIEQLHQLSTDRDLRAFLKLRSADTREAARIRLTGLAGTAPRRIELWDRAGVRLLEVTATGQSERGTAARALPEGVPPSAPGIGPIEGSPDLAFSDIVAEIRDDGATEAGPPPAGRLGYVRMRTTFRESPPGIFSRLVGRDAIVRVGNRTGGTWTDFTRLLPAPSIDLERQGVTQYRNANGDLRLGAVSLIPATPWAVWVEFSHANIIAPARVFLRDMTLTALAAVIGAGVFAFVLAGRITRPISEINTAASAIAAGDYSRRAPEHAEGEIGHLGRTFNAMAAEVKDASDALKRSEESYRRLFASNPHPMWVYDVETLRFLDVNDMATAHYGYSRDEFLAMTIKDIRPESDVPALLESVTNASVTVVPSALWKHRKKDGAIIDVEVSSHELMLNGRRARIVLPHDVTVEIRAQRELRESETRFRGMAETMPHVVWTARPDGHRTYYNQRWFDYTGQRPDEPLGHGWQAMLHPDDREDTVSQWTQAVRTGGSPALTYRLKRRDGVYRWHIGRAAPLRNEAGAIVMWVGTVTDIDDARRGQEMLETLNLELEQRVQARTAELESANQELEAFSYSVSHDLRAPLRHVQGYVELLSGSTEGQLSDRSRRYLTTINDATVQMGQLIDDLLAFSRMARSHMSESTVSLDAVVRDTIAGLEMTTKGRDIVWKISPLPAAIGDMSMLKQVVANLIGNAVKYTSGRAQAEIEIGCDGEEDGRRVFFVRDNGAGFDMRYAQKLFGVFQRLHRADEFEGTGIGLATVRRIVSRHGGRTWAEGQIDKGATFYFTLRTADAQHS